MEQRTFRRNEIRTPFEKCPTCGADVRLRLEEVNGEKQLKLFNPDDSQHVCQIELRNEFEKHPIGQTVTGKRVTDFQLRGRRLTITLEDGHVLTISAAGRPLTIRLEGPSGLLQE